MIYIVKYNLIIIITKILKSHYIYIYINKYRIFKKIKIIINIINLNKKRKLD